MSDRFLFISDTQIPFEAEHALRFCKAVQREFKIPDECVYHVGDETDLYFASAHPKSPDRDLTARQELSLAKSRLKEWYKQFPRMKLAISNHGLRVLRRAIDADLPSYVLKSYQKMIAAPKEWVWKPRWEIVGSKTKITMIHGMGYSGQQGHKNAAVDIGTNTVIGHLHSHAGINYINTDNRKIWAANAGCLIDVESFAFEYGKYNRQKPVLSILVVIDGGLTPILLPYERFL